MATMAIATIVSMSAPPLRKAAPDRRAAEERRNEAKRGQVIFRHCYGKYEKHQYTDTPNLL
jgi:hypothetical protein